ncbi:MAG: membrane protein insertase YidC [Bacteroidota bacterium]
MSNNSTLDRNTLTGLFLMGLILVLYSLWFPSNNPDPKGSTQGPSEDTLLVSKDTAAKTLLQNQNSEARPTEAGTTESPMDSATLLSPFGQHLQGNPETYTLRNQNLELTFNAKGGALNQAKILGYKTYAGDSLKLFDGNSLKMSYAMITGDKVWNSSQLYFQPVHDADPRSLTLQVDFGPDKSGAPQQILHRYRLDSAGYRLNFSVQFVNMERLIRNDYTTMEWACIAPAQERDISEERRLMEVYYRFPGEDPDYMSMSSPNEENLNNNLEWISFRQKFFCAVLGAEDHFDRAQIKGEASKQDGQTGMYRAELTLDHRANASKPFAMWMYLGPNHFQTLKAQDCGLEKQLPLGWGIFGWVNRFIVIPVFNWLDSFQWNYGLIILILTLIIKIILFPLTYKSLISGAKMKVLKPEIDQLKEKFEKDPTRMQSEQMKLFQKAGVNPLGGCLPMLMQLPILIALFNFFPASIELRQQAFLWADDLSSYDSIADLPFSIPFYGAHVSLFTLLMTASTLLYTRMSNQMSGVTGQMKVMGYVMPLMFIPVLNSYSAALSYYYFLANMVSFGQQWIVRRFFINEDSLLKQIEENKKKPVKKSSFQQKMEDLARKARENRDAAPSRKSKS